MSARPTPTGISLSLIADQLNDTRHLVGAATMALADFEAGDRRSALRALLAVIEDKLIALSAAVLPGGGT